MRLKSLDIARGIGIILVVAGHFFPEMSPHWYGVARSVVYSFHMPLFLLISGYVYILSRRDETYASFLKRKAKRVVIPYFLVSFSFIFIKFIPQMLSLYVKNPVTPESFIKVFYMPEAAVSLWYLWALWWFYLIVPLLKTRTSRLVMLAFSIVLAYLPFDMPDVFALGKVKEMFRYFMLGAVLADWSKEISFLKRMPLVLPVSVFAALVALWLCLDIKSGFLLALSGTASVLSFSECLVPYVEKGKLGWLMKTADDSYTIYLLHPIFIAAALAVLHKLSLPLSESWCFALVALAVTVIGLTGPMILSWIWRRVR